MSTKISTKIPAQTQGTTFGYTLVAWYSTFSRVDGQESSESPLKLHPNPLSSSQPLLQPFLTKNSTKIPAQTQGTPFGYTFVV